MSRYSETDTSSQAADWLMGTARRKPEALLLLAAGCCLLMRSGGSSSARAASHSRYGEDPRRIVSATSHSPVGLRQTSGALHRMFARGYHAPRTAPPITLRRSRIGSRIPRVLMPSRSPSSPTIRAAMCPSVRRA